MLLKGRDIKLFSYVKHLACVGKTYEIIFIRTVASMGRNKKQSTSTLSSTMEAQEDYTSCTSLHWPICCLQPGQNLHHIKETMLKLMESYLTGRTTAFMVHVQIISSTVRFQSGVGEGSIVGPIFFVTTLYEVINIDRLCYRCVDTLKVRLNSS